MSSVIVFIVHEAEEGGYWACAVGHDIITQGDTVEEIRANIREAVECHFDPDEPKPDIIKLHYVREEVLARETSS
jgi:predicted RNase H-like HicB family nuclease